MNDIVDSFLVEIDLAKISLSCHFALDLQCYKSRCLLLHNGALGTCPWSSLCFCGTIATFASSCLARRCKSLFHVSLFSLAGAISSRVFPYPYVALVRTVTICQGRHAVFLRPGHVLRSYLLPEKAASVMCFDAVLGKFYLPYWCFIVVRHGGNVRRGVFFFLFLRLSRRRHTSTLPQTRFSRSRRLESSLRTIDPLRHVSSSLGLFSAGVAPLPPSYRKLLDETVKTFVVFPSRLYLFDGDDNCMLSVPLSTSDQH